MLSREIIYNFLNFVLRLDTIYSFMCKASCLYDYYFLLNLAKSLCRTFIYINTFTSVMTPLQLKLTFCALSYAYSHGFRSVSTFHAVTKTLHIEQAVSLFWNRFFTSVWASPSSI